MKISVPAIIAGLAVLPTALGLFNCTSKLQSTREDPYNITAEALAAAEEHLAKRDIITIPLYIHFIVSSWDVRLDSPGLMNQFWYLNRVYEQFGVQFQLRPVSYAMNGHWADAIENDLANKQRQLHKGDYKSVNVYLVEKAVGGWCTYPLGGNSAIAQTQLDGDGCFVPLRSGVNAPDGTIAHEIGHWFGLAHVFEGGCEGDGDWVDDTWPQAGPSYGRMSRPGDFNSCPATKSCPTKPGSDNVKNFMDYTDCSSEFTLGQRARALAVYQTYRQNRAIASGVMWKD